LRQESIVTDDHQVSSSSVAPVDEIPSGADEELRDLGITTHEHTSYEWNGYRYSSAKDAIAAAKRARG
jgi:hypothetical protein